MNAYESSTSSAAQFLKCLLYRLIKEHETLKRFSCHILYFIFKGINNMKNRHGTQNHIRDD